MALPHGVLLRTATLHDAADAARMHRECWREAYASLVDGDLLAARLENAATWEDAWREHVVHGPPRTLAVADGEVLGFAVAGPNRDEGPQFEELYALYVRSSWWGSGIGQALLDDVLAHRPATLWVLEDNARARAFYARNGFHPDGERTHSGWLDAWEVRLVR